MTAHTVGFLATSSGTSPVLTALSSLVVLRAVDFPVRVIQCEFVAVASTTISAGAYFSRFEGGASAGGATIQPAPPRENSAPVTAVVRHRALTYNNSTGSYTDGTAVTNSGTERRLKLKPPLPAAADGTNQGAALMEWTPTTETVIAPGSALYFAPVLPSAVSTTTRTYFSHWQLTFDEERVSRSA